MPIKRPHKKSRYGCDECRRRRVKCDENQPRCSDCMHRDAACHYSRRAESCPSSSGSRTEITSAIDASTKTGQDLTIHPFRRASGLLVNTSARRSIRSRELELMHYWCTRTCYSFSPQLAELFRDHVGREALRHDFLMEALLAVTSLHIASETEDTMTARLYVSATLQYHDQAVSGLRETVHDISPTTCVAIFASSAMIMICAIVSPLLPACANDEVKSTAEAMLHVVDLLRGLSSIVDVSRQWLLHGPFGEVLRSAIPRRPSAIRESFPAQKLRQLNDALLSSSNCALDELDHARRKHQVFQDAIQKLEQAFENGISMLPWLLKIDPEFLDALRKKESMAVAVFMHWGVLLDQLDDMWWAKYSGKRLVRELSATLDDRGKEWDQVVRWCEVQVGLCS